jgi:DNA primase
MRFDDRFLDDIRARLAVSQVVGRRVALKKKGREYAGLSPFKQEKTASFFVNDQKGFYHCFASGEHGDIFKFLMQTEGLTFPEAVERLAGEAGVPMPVRSERDRVQDAQVQDERARLQELLAASAAFFRCQLRSSAGLEARRYIERRGLKPDTVEAFGLGFAPNSKTALKEHLAKAGFSVADMVRSGMLIGGDDIPLPYDRFRNRVMFPITDLKDRPIAFGGRALDPGQPAKYLNSPETPLFHKGNVLFNAARARPHAHTKGRVIVVEGYMDVVALSEAGFGEAVAPLGTALTQEQVKLLWRLVPEPVLCFDGDSAGRKAAHRAIDTVLPHLMPGTSLAFAFLPDGLDPDDLVRQRGPEALGAILADPKPLAAVLFEREWTSGDWSTPERRARLDQRLRDLTRSIGDASVRAHYERDIRERLYAASRAAPRSAAVAGHRGALPKVNGQRPPAPKSAGPGYARRGPGAAFQPPGYTDSLRNNSMTLPDSAILPRGEALLMYTVLNHPWLLESKAETIAHMTLTAEPLQRLRRALLSMAAAEKPLDRAELRTQLLDLGFGGELKCVESCFTHRGDRFAEPEAEISAVEAGWRDTFALHRRTLGQLPSRTAAELAWRNDLSEDAAAEIVELHAGVAVAHPDDDSNGSLDA